MEENEKILNDEQFQFFELSEDVMDDTFLEDLEDTLDLSEILETVEDMHE